MLVSVETSRVSPFSTEAVAEPDAITTAVDERADWGMLNKPDPSPVKRDDDTLSIRIWVVNERLPNSSDTKTDPLIRAIPRLGSA